MITKSTSVFIFTSHLFMLWFWDNHGCSDTTPMYIRDLERSRGGGRTVLGRALIFWLRGNAQFLLTLPQTLSTRTWVWYLPATITFRGYLIRKSHVSSTTPTIWLRHWVASRLYYSQGSPVLSFRAREGSNDGLHWDLTEGGINLSLVISYRQRFPLHGQEGQVLKTLHRL